MLPDTDTLYESLAARDRRFEGLAFICVRTTGIYCRFGCPARTPLRKNVEFRATVADCEAAGFRACLRCHPAAGLIAPSGRSSRDGQRRPTAGKG